MIGWWAWTAAVAGELIVTTATPVIVRVDNVPIDFVPGTMVAQVAGLQGIHSVEILSVTGQLKARLNVSVPAQGGAGLVFDGTTLAMASAGAGGVAAVIGGGVAGGIVVGTPAAPAAPAAPPQPAKPTSMSAAAFRQLLTAVEDASFSDDKINTIRTAASSNWFTIAQLAQILDALDFSNDKVSAATVCRPKVVDPENAFELSSHLDFSGDRDAVMKLFR